MNQQNFGYQQAYESEVDFRKLFSIISKYRYLILLIVFISVSVAVIYNAMQLPVYRASARLLVDSGSNKVVKNEDVELPSYRDSLLFSNSQLEILKSNVIAKQVSDDVGGYLPWQYRAAASPSKDLKPLTDADRADALRKSIKVRLLPRTQVIEISSEDSDPAMAERIANAWVYAYINFSMRSGVVVNQKSGEGFEKAAEKAKQRLRDAQGKLDRYRKERDLSISDEESLNAPADATLLGQLIKKKSELEVQLAQQLNYFKEKHPVIIGLRSELKSIDQEIAGQSALREKTVEYSILKREVDTSRSVYESFMNRILHTEAIEGLKSNIKIVEEAQAPKKPVRPRKLYNLMLSLFGGIFSSVVLAFLFEGLDFSVRTVDDIKNVIGVPFLGIIPLAAKPKIPAVLGGPAEKKVFLKDFESQFSPIAESYRSLRTAIIFSSADMKRKSFLLTSAGPQEGKSTTATNLAIVMAQAGERTLLVDADLRRPNVHNFFNLPNEKGLTDIFMDEQRGIFDNIRSTAIDNLDVLVCGVIPPNPSELLGSSKMEWIIEELRKVYDKVIFDTPPVLAATDAVVLSTKVEGVVFVMKANQTHKQAAIRSKELIGSAGSKIIGAVLNMVDAKRRHGYYDYYYYSHYDKYYGDYGKTKRSDSAKSKAEDQSLLKSVQKG